MSTVFTFLKTVTTACHVDSLTGCKTSVKLVAGTNTWLVTSAERPASVVVIVAVASVAAVPYWGGV